MFTSGTVFTSFADVTESTHAFAVGAAGDACVDSSDVGELVDPNTVLDAITAESHAHVGTKGRQSRDTGSRFDHTVMQSQARDVLVGLGWKPGIARAAVEEACAPVGSEVPVEQLIAEALRRCPRPLGAVIINGQSKGPRVAR